ncbi:MAG: prolyl oligopeptidase family serine peptidase, partial [Planctomycetes bacterium]|nr:prolyl oligopeptidase family serine peptidase [Planctomycetota bacterium]
MFARILVGTVVAITPFTLADDGAPRPVTRTQAVTDTYHGVSVTEYYRWLENGNDPAVRDWSEAQDAHARAILDHLPHIEAIRARATEIIAAKTVSYSSPAFEGGRLFAIKRQPPKQQPFLVVVDKPDLERVLVDPNAIDEKGLTAIDWYVPSPDGKLVAVSLSVGGSESGDVHLYQTATGEQAYEVIPRVNGGTAGGDLAWSSDGSGFFYTRYPRGQERPAEDRVFYQQLYYHKLGTPTEDDRYELGKDLPRIAEIQLQADTGSGRLLVTVQKGDGGQFAHYLRSTDGKWRQFSVFGDQTLQAAFGPHDDLFILSRKDAPRGKVLRTRIADLDVSKAQVIIPQGADTIVEDFWGPPTVLPTATRLYVQYQLGGPSQIRVFDHQGKRMPAPEQLAVGAVAGLTPLGGDDVLFANWSFVQPSAWYRFNPQSEQTTKTSLVTESPVDFSDVKVVREFATSADGTKVPVNILLPKGIKLDGSNPCVVSGYGGYGVNLGPRFRATRKLLLEQGVIYAVANLRGGGEYGQEWHHQGNLTHKQNVFDDFAAVLQHLI